MKDIFDGIILCSKCKQEMKKGVAIRDGFRIRYAYCKKCNERLWHPGDLASYKNFSNLKRREFRVKLRVVGNSYAVTLPKEIINFIKEIEKEFNIKANEEIKLMLDELGKLKLIFEEIEEKIKSK
jgi:hypothetical protein